VTKGRVNWSPEAVAELTRLYYAGRTRLDMAQAMDVSETSIQMAIARFDLDRGDSLRLRKEGVVRRFWTSRPPGNIGQAFRFPVEEVREIAQRLMLGPETAKNKTRRSVGAFSATDISWAYHARRSCPEAALVWDMVRASQGLQPVGKGYRV
jgi:hypothetical protein